MTLSFRLRRDRQLRFDACREVRLEQVRLTRSVGAQR